MFTKRKVLYSAIAAVLMANANVAVAATGLILCSGDCTDDEPYEVAVEDINKNKGIATDATADGMIVIYTPATAINQDFYMTFTLSGGAVWKSGSAIKTNLSFTKTDLTDCTTPLSVTGPSAVSGDPSSIYFYVNSKDCPIDTAQATTDDDTAVTGSFTFSFAIYDKNATLGTADSKIELSVALELSTNPDKKLDTAADDDAVDLVQSVEAHKITVSTDTPRQSSTPVIDVAQGSTVFAVQGTATNTARLGSIMMKDVGSGTAENPVNGTWNFDAEKVTGGTLVISAAPLNASVIGGKVYIDDGDGVYNEHSDEDTYDGDFLATKVEDTEATWELTADELNGLNDACQSPSLCELVIEVDGTTAIIDQSDTASALLTVQYTQLTKTIQKKLLHIKRNGTVCTLFNIPSEGLLDDASVRISNMSNKEGIVLGTLKDMSGAALFTNLPLIGGADAIYPDPIKPKETIRISSAGLKEASGGTFTGRGVLTLSSDVPVGKMEIFGLVRNNTQKGGPLMNLSTGASGDGCGD